MNRDSQFTFKKFSDPSWPLRSGHDFGAHYVPDEIFAPLVEVLQSRAPDIFTHSMKINEAADQCCRSRLWLWTETIGFVEKVWRDLDPEYGDFMAQCIADGFFKYQMVPYGFSTGNAHPKEKVNLRCDLSVNDPVCAVHESGHLAGFDAGYKIFENYGPAPNIEEIQSIFVQEHAYKLLHDRSHNDDEVMAIRLHRLRYHINQLTLIPLHTWRLDQRPMPGRHSRSLPQQLSHWSLDQKLLTVFNKRELKPDGAQSIHAHPFAALVAPVLHALFVDADATRKRAMLRTLYEGSCDTHLTDVLSAFDINTEADLRAVGAITCARLVEDIKACGFGGKPPLSVLFPQ